LRIVLIIFALNALSPDVLILFTKQLSHFDGFFYDMELNFFNNFLMIIFIIYNKNIIIQ